MVAPLVTHPRYDKSSYISQIQQNISDEIYHVDEIGYWIILFENPMSKTHAEKAFERVSMALMVPLNLLLYF